jgi:ABC-type proline/glycine betaine transport system ATPase subunit
MEEKGKIKIKVEDLTLIFGKRKQGLLLYLRKGFQRRKKEDSL